MPLYLCGTVAATALGTKKKWKEIPNREYYEEAKYTIANKK